MDGGRRSAVGGEGDDEWRMTNDDLRVAIFELRMLNFEEFVVFLHK